MRNCKKFSIVWYVFFVLFALIVQSCSVGTQNELVGQISFIKWKNSTYWNESEYLNYRINLDKIDLLSKKLENIQYIYIFASPYCDKCLIEIPHLYKILEMLPKNQDKFVLFALDEYNTEPTKTYKHFGVTTTPTFVVIYNNKKQIKFHPRNYLLDDLLENLE